MRKHKEQAEDIEVQLIWPQWHLFYGESVVEETAFSPC